MNKKIASLFASVGFDIDTTDLTKLDGHLKSIRGSAAKLSTNLRSVNEQAKTTASRMRSLASAAEAVTKFNNLGGKYTTLSIKVKDAETAIARFGRVLKLIEPRLDSTNFRLSTTVRSYRDLAAAVREANRELSRTPNRPPRPIPPLGGGRGNGGGGGGSGGGQGGGAGAGFLGGLLGTLGRFTPTGLVGGTALTTAAVGVNEIRKAGQDQQRMENMLLFSTKSQEEYARSLEYVRKEADRLGLNSVELGKAFAQVNMSANEKLSEQQRKKMFTDMSEYIMVTGAGQEDQKLIFKAVNQMFSLGRIMAEEMNQLTERGVPRQMIYDVAKEVYNVKSTKEVLDLQKDGKLDPAKILPLVFERFAQRGRDTGAYDKMQGSSIASQNRFMESLRRFSANVMEAGLDKALATFFDTLNAGIPYITTFIKGVGGAIKGVFLLTKVVWGVVKAIGSFVGENPKTVAALSVLIGLFAVLIDYNIKTISNFTMLGKILSTIGRRIPLIAMLLALFYLFKEYDRYMKGEDSWMANFADWMIYLIETVKWWKEEIIGAFNAVKELRFGDVKGGGVLKSVGKMILDNMIPPIIRKPITKGLLNTHPPSDVPIFDKLGNPIGYNFNPNYNQGGNNPLKGYVAVDVNLKYPNGQVEKVMVNTPVQRVSTGGLLT